MQSLFPTGAQSGEKVLLQFPAGKCNMALLPNGKYGVTADPRRGSLSLVRSADGTVHFKWTVLPANKVEDDRMVFAGENVFKKVNTGRENDRVYMLQYLTGNQRHMFWMQEKSPEHDEDRLKKMNDLINNPNAEGAAGGAASAGAGGQAMGANEWMQMLGLPPAAAAGAGAASAAPSVPPQVPNTSGFANLDLSSLLRPAAGAAAGAPTAAAGATGTAAPTTAPSGATQQPVTLEDLQRAMFGNRPTAAAAAAAPRAPATPALNDIFQGEDILNSGILNNPDVVADLVSELPPEQRSAQHLESTLRSPQFQQALGSLTHAVMHPDNYQSVMSNFNINPAPGMNQLIAGDGVGAFLTALQSDVDANNSTSSAAETKEESKDGGNNNNNSSSNNDEKSSD